MPSRPLGDASLDVDGVRRHAVWAAGELLGERPQGGNLNELRGEFERDGEGYRFRLVGPGGACGWRAFRPLLDDEHFEELRWSLEDYMDLPDGGSRTRAAGIERRMDGWGQDLQRSLFDNADGGVALRELPGGSAPRLLTIATDVPEILRQPWELLADATGPLSRQEVTTRRQLGRAGQPAEVRVTVPLRILLVVSRPDDTGFIDPRLTTRSILDTVAPLGEAVQLHFCEPATLPHMEELLAAARTAGRPYVLSCPLIDADARCREEALPLQALARRGELEGKRMGKVDLSQPHRRRSTACTPSVGVMGWFMEDSTSGLAGPGWRSAQ